VTGASLRSVGQRLSDDDVLDNPVWASLAGAHSSLAVVVGQARRYPPDVAPFVGVPDHPDDGVWDDLRHLLSAGEVIALTGGVTAPPGWTEVSSGEGVQLVSTAALESRPYLDAVTLGPDDVEDMLALVARTKPGPFLPRTYLLGNYLGVRVDGRLVAMAGERLHPPGWTEISAVCTDANYRGRGYGTRLVQAVAHGIRTRGERPMLHAAATNVGAIRLYESLGFELRKRTTFSAVRLDDHDGATS
jgi:ribosomal protein S18 acetylase RimI-like enzyme